VRSPGRSPRPAWREVRSELGAHRRRRAARRSLARELASYTSARDLADLDATLERHPDDEAAPIRRLVAARPRG
jgi:hypothetical protein